MAAETMALGCHVGPMLVRHLICFYVLLTFNCTFVMQYQLTVGSPSRATMPFAWRSLEEACRCSVSLGGSVTASASCGVPEAIHFLNSGRKQGGRVGAAGQRGSPGEMCSPGAGRTRRLPGRGGRLAPCLAQGVVCSCSAAEISPFLLHQSLLAKGFTGAAASIIAEITSLCFVPELVLGWAPAPRQCRGTVVCTGSGCS